MIQDNRLLYNIEFFAYYILSVRFNIISTCKFCRDLGIYYSDRDFSIYKVDLNNRCGRIFFYTNVPFLLYTKSNQLINQIVIEAVMMDVLYRCLGHTDLSKLYVTTKQMGIKVTDKEFHYPSYTIAKSKKKVSRIY
jgi:hypothetical protein